jgi:hypothetical protein
MKFGIREFKIIQESSSTGYWDNLWISTLNEKKNVTIRIKKDWSNTKLNFQHSKIFMMCQHFLGMNIEHIL